MNEQPTILADSIHNGFRVITIQTISPKFLDAEIEKHGMLATNSSSSRAIPYQRTRYQVSNDPFLPSDVRYNQAGMQGSKRLSIDDQAKFNSISADMVNDICFYTDKMEEIGVHKQTINRYLDPFSIQMKVITGNVESFDAMIRLRDHQAADPSIQQWASAVKKAIASSSPKELSTGEWHLPFSNRIEQSVARVARVSYYRANLIDSYKKDVELHDKLKDMGHWSCFEHQLKAPHHHSMYTMPWPKGVTHYNRKLEMCSGRIRGWITYRALAEEY